MPSYEAPHFVKISCLSGFCDNRGVGTNLMYQKEQMLLTRLICVIGRNYACLQRFKHLSTVLEFEFESVWINLLFEHLRSESELLMFYLIERIVLTNLLSNNYLQWARYFGCCIYLSNSINSIKFRIEWWNIRFVCMNFLGWFFVLLLSCWQSEASNLNCRHILILFFPFHSNF